MSFRDRSRRLLREEAPERVLLPILRPLVADAARLMGERPADARSRAASARAAAVRALEPLHAELRAAFERRGIHYHRVETAAEARALVHHLLRRSRRVAKSKSMVCEEIGLTPYLRARGIDVMETDIGEYLVDLEGRGPSHITAPALHLNRARIRELLARTGADVPDDDPLRLSRAVRDAVAAFVADCDAAITGANAVVARSGRIVIVENEGNVALGVSHPRLHIVVTGLEKVVADEAAALAVLEVLAPNATGQQLTAFTHFVADPLPGQERHVIFVDNGRSRILRDERYRDLLRCIRCGACMNACPVYRVAGGLAYGSPYMGPIGAVLSPLLWRDGRYADLPFASTLCGRCSEVCPVGIPLHRMLLELRADAVRARHVGSAGERAGWRLWAAAFTRPPVARAATLAGRLLLPILARARRRSAADPRTLPDLRGPRGEGLRSARPPHHEPGPSDARRLPDDLLDRFRQRAGEAAVHLLDSYEPAPGDRLVLAAAGIALTGSVLLAGEAAARRPLLAAERVVIELDPARIVPLPRDLEPFLTGEARNDALILTGPSRTADIEKQIVRGIHGPAEIAILLKREERP